MPLEKSGIMNMQPTAAFTPCIARRCSTDDPYVSAALFDRFSTVVRAYLSTNAGRPPNIITTGICALRIAQAKSVASTASVRVGLSGHSKSTHTRDSAPSREASTMRAPSGVAMVPGTTRPSPSFNAAMQSISALPYDPDGPSKIIAW